jgi:hypothetical protein
MAGFTVPSKEAIQISLRAGECSRSRVGRGLIPDSDLRIFEESSHFIAGDEPRAFLDAIAGFVVYNNKK